MRDTQYNQNDKVYKPSGYPFPGVVLGSFITMAGKERVVVESTELPGLIHIFAPDQLALFVEDDQPKLPIFDPRHAVPAGSRTFA